MPTLDVQYVVDPVALLERLRECSWYRVTLYTPRRVALDVRFALLDHDGDCLLQVQVDDRLFRTTKQYHMDDHGAFEKVLRIAMDWIASWGVCEACLQHLTDKRLCNQCDKAELFKLKLLDPCVVCQCMDVLVHKLCLVCSAAVCVHCHPRMDHANQSKCPQCRLDYKPFHDTLLKAEPVEPE